MSPISLNSVEDLSVEELRERARRAAGLDLVREGTLADNLRQSPPARFCGWAGLDPHLQAPGEEYARCRTCTRNGTCAEAWKLTSL